MRSRFGRGSERRARATLTTLAVALASLCVTASAAAALRPGDIVVSDPFAFGGTGGLIKVDPGTGRESKLSANNQAVNASSGFFRFPQTIALDAKGNILVADIDAYGGTGGVIKVNPKTGKESKLSANNQAVNASHQLFADPIGVAVDPKGKVLVADDSAFGGTGGIIKVNPKTGKESKLSANNQAVNASHQLFETPEGLTVGRRGKILVTDQAAFGGDGGIIKVNPKTGKESKLSANDQAVNATHQLFVEPTDVTVDSSGKILVADQLAFGGPGGIIKVNPRTGLESVLSSNDLAVNATHQLFASAVGIALDRKGRILVADYSAFGGIGGVIKVDPATGQESKLSANDQPVNATHQLFDAPVFLAVVPK
jgi:sugar lactone lactonase YvrE